MVVAVFMSLRTFKNPVCVRAILFVSPDMELPKTADDRL